MPFLWKLFATVYLFGVFTLAAAADARDTQITYKDKHSRQLVNAVYFDCYQSNPSWDGRYVKLIDAIRITLRTMRKDQFKLVFESRNGTVYGVGTLMDSAVGATPVTMRAFVINPDGSLELQKMYNDRLLDSMCMSDGNLGPYSAAQLGLPEKQWKSAREIGIR